MGNAVTGFETVEFGGKAADILGTCGLGQDEPVRRPGNDRDEVVTPVVAGKVVDADPDLRSPARLQVMPTKPARRDRAGGFPAVRAIVSSRSTTTASAPLSRALPSASSSSPGTSSQDRGAIGMEPPVEHPRRHSRRVAARLFQAVGSASARVG
jgi:hypothetical protein